MEIKKYWLYTDIENGDKLFVIGINGDVIKYASFSKTDFAALFTVLFTGLVLFSALQFARTSSRHSFLMSVDRDYHEAKMQKQDLQFKKTNKLANKAMNDLNNVFINQ